LLEGVEEDLHLVVLVELLLLAHIVQPQEELGGGQLLLQLGWVALVLEEILMLKEMMECGE
jgi:hypothetical protein